MNGPRTSSFLVTAARSVLSVLRGISNGRLYRLGVLSLVGACGLYGLSYAPPARAASFDHYQQAYNLCQFNLAHRSDLGSSAKCSLRGSNREFYITGVNNGPGYTYCSVPSGWVDDGWNNCAFGSGTCPSGDSRLTRLPKYYSAPGPFYATLPGTPCQCTFFMKASWQDPFGGPGVTSGMCTSTGRLMGDNGDEVDPPPVLTDAPSDPPANPCDGGALSCYDTGGNQFCYGSGSKQVCVPGPQGPSDPSPGQTPPKCTQGDGVAICGGTPDAPQPSPKPEGDPIGDTNYTTSDGAGAPPSNTQIITWDTTGQGNNKDPGDGSSSTGSTGNGGNNGSQGSADGAGKCADGSVPSAGGCGAGYSDNGCDAPPTCSGDPLLCASLREQHATRCAAAEAGKPFELTGNAAVDDAAIDAAVAAGTPTFEPGCLWNCIGEDGDGDPGDPDDGSSKLEVTRFWGPRHECPGVPDSGIPGLESFGAQVSAPLCQTTGTWGMIILALGYAFGTIAFARTLAAG